MLVLWKRRRWLREKEWTKVTTAWPHWPRVLWQFLDKAFFILCSCWCSMLHSYKSALKNYTITDPNYDIIRTKTPLSHIRQGADGRRPERRKAHDDNEGQTWIWNNEWFFGGILKFCLYKTTTARKFILGNCFQKPCINWPKTIPQMREFHRKEREGG